MDPKMRSHLLFAGGLLILVVSLVADSLGLGAVSGIGYKQVIGAVVGAALAVAGYVMK